MPNLNKLKNKKDIEIYCDGTGFPARESCYCVIVSPNKHAERHKIYLETHVLEERLNVDIIEHLGFIRALEIANLFESDKQIKVFTDRIGIVKEIETLTFPKKKFEEKIKALLKPNISVSWVRRNDNLAGQYLERRNIKLKYFSNRKFSRSYL